MGPQRIAWATADILDQWFLERTSQMNWQQILDDHVFDFFWRFTS